MGTPKNYIPKIAKKVLKICLLQLKERKSFGTPKAMIFEPRTQSFRVTHDPTRVRIFLVSFCVKNTIGLGFNVYDYIFAERPRSSISTDTICKHSLGIRDY